MLNSIATGPIRTLALLTKGSFLTSLITRCLSAIVKRTWDCLRFASRDLKPRVLWGFGFVNISDKCISYILNPPMDLGGFLQLFSAYATS